MVGSGSDLYMFAKSFPVNRQLRVQYDGGGSGVCGWGWWCVWVGGWEGGT